MPTTAEFRQRLSTTGLDQDVAEIILDMFDEANARNGAAAEQLGARLDRHEAKNDDQFRTLLDQVTAKIADLHKELIEFRIETERRFSETQAENERRYAELKSELAELRADNERRHSELRAEIDQRHAETEKSLSKIREENERRFGAADRRALALGLSLAGLIIAAAAATIAAVALLAA